MRHPATVVLVPILLIACARPSANARIEGRVLAGPTCPVESPGAECDPVPWTGTVRATGEDGDVHETETDESGAYAIDLPPGTYVVVPVTGTGAPPTGVPQTVRVVEGQPRRVDLEVDTGIR